jgi:hypothetical protein
MGLPEAWRYAVQNNLQVPLICGDSVAKHPGCLRQTNLSTMTVNKPLQPAPSSDACSLNHSLKTQTSAPVARDRKAMPPQLVLPESGTEHPSNSQFFLTFHSLYVSSLPHQIFSVLTSHLSLGIV